MKKNTTVRLSGDEIEALDDMARRFSEKSGFPITRASVIRMACRQLLDIEAANLVGVHPKKSASRR